MLIARDQISPAADSRHMPAKSVISPSQPWGTRRLHRHYPPPAGNAKNLTRLGSNPERKSAAAVQRRSRPGTNAWSSRERVSGTTEFITCAENIARTTVLVRSFILSGAHDICLRSDRAKGARAISMLWKDGLTPLIRLESHSCVGLAFAG